MYKIVGADGKEYGPVSAEQLRQWITERRVNSKSLARAEGETGWKPLGTLPEFTLLFGANFVGAAVPLPPVYPQRTSGFALTGLIMGVIAITLGMCCCYGIPFNILGIIFSLIGLAQINRNPEVYSGRGLAITGLILSILTLVLFAVLMAVGLAFGWEDIVRDLNI